MPDKHGGWVHVDEAPRSSPPLVGVAADRDDAGLVHEQRGVGVQEERVLRAARPGQRSVPDKRSVECANALKLGLSVKVVPVKAACQHCAACALCALAGQAA